MDRVSRLSILLPVYNAQPNLEADVVEMLEVLADVARDFQLWIIDDGSLDETSDVARQLAAGYPQVRLLRHPVRLGLCEAIQTGLDHTQGDVILVGDEDYCLDPDDLRTLWQMRDTQWQLSRQEALPIANRPSIARLLAWRPRASQARRGFQIISRQAFEKFRLQQAVDTVHRLDIGWHGSAPQGPEWPKFHTGADRMSTGWTEDHLPMFGGGDYAAF